LLIEGEISTEKSTMLYRENEIYFSTRKLNEYIISQTLHNYVSSKNSARTNDEMFTLDYEQRRLNFLGTTRSPLYINGILSGFGKNISLLFQKARIFFPKGKNFELAIYSLPNKNSLETCLKNKKMEEADLRRNCKRHRRTNKT